MKQHRPTVHVTPTGTIRQCQDCTQSWELVRGVDGSQWHPIEETDETGHILKSKRDVWECGGEAPTTQERSTKSTYAASSGASTRGNDLCYCAECSGKAKHFPDAKNCYCKACKGRKAHYG